MLDLLDLPDAGALSSRLIAKSCRRILSESCSAAIYAGRGEFEWCKCRIRQLDASILCLSFSTTVVTRLHDSTAPGCKRFLVVYSTKDSNSNRAEQATPSIQPALACLGLGPRKCTPHAGAVRSIRKSPGAVAFGCRRHEILGRECLFRH